MQSHQNPRRENQISTKHVTDTLYLRQSDSITHKRFKIPKARTYTNFEILESAMEERPRSAKPRNIILFSFKNKPKL